MILGRKSSIEADPRKKKTVEGFVKRGATFIPTNYIDIDHLSEQFKRYRVDCVISTLAVQDPDAIGSAEVGLVKAAAQSGTVRRVFPSQYGPDDEMLHGSKSVVYHRKKRIIDLIRSLGMTYTVVVTGIYIDAMFTYRIMGWNDEGPEAIRIGEGGQGRVMGITRQDIGRYIAEMCVDSEEKTRDKIVRIVGDSWNSGDEIKIFEQVTGKHVKVQEFPHKVKVNHPKHTHPLSVYPRLLATNHFYISPALWDSQRWPMVKPTTLREFCESEYSEKHGSKL